jgi:ABC-type Fe3+/spermidine/putrescine transport system ATPase subunit
MTLECRAVCLSYGSTPVLRDLDLALATGESVALLGPSGSGKTSLLYAVAGFLPVASGEILIGGEVVSRPGLQLAPERRDVAVVFQHYALWPHLSALETAAYPLRRRGVAGAEARRRALELLDLMGVAHLAERRPAELSGGEQQRVGVARALAREARLLLLDEPTAHLDTPLRVALMAELAEQRRRTGAAALYATHDVAEALAVADRVALLREGSMVQLGTPQQIYEEPVDLWAARLSGPASVLDANLVALDSDAGWARVRLDERDVPVALGPAAGAQRGPVQLLVRPDWASIGGYLDAVVASVWYRGPYTDYRLETSAGQLELREAGPPRAVGGERIGWRLERAWLLGA